ncbi:hypothetical protein GF314_08540, partial [bacterium]|nr:hypothetical protein [bacterium]
MTNREYRDAHRLTGREKHEIWQEIRDPDARRRRPRVPRWLAWTGGAAAAAACALAVAILTGDQDGGGAPGIPDVAVRSFETPE